MKLLIAFAFFAVAFADEIRVVALPPSPLYSMPGMGQVIIPNYVIDAIKIGIPVMRDDGVVPEGVEVYFVDAPLDVNAPEFVHVVDFPTDGSVPETHPFEPVQVVDAPEPVWLGQAPLPAYEIDESAPGPVNIVDITEEFVPEPVQIAEAPLPALETADVDAPFYQIALEPVRIVKPSPPEVASYAQEIAPEPVLIAKASLPVFETVDAVKIAEPEVAPFVPEAVQIAEAPLPALKTADAPLNVAAPEPVSLPKAALPAFETVEASAPVIEAVRIAVPEFNDYRGKQFDDPRLR